MVEVIHCGDDGCLRRMLTTDKAEAVYEESIDDLMLCTQLRPVECDGKSRRRVYEGSLDDYVSPCPRPGLRFACFDLLAA
jgi:hypothetical protein